MTNDRVAQVERLAQQLTNSFKRTKDLLDEAWLEHELARDDLRHLLIAYYKWLGHEGIAHEY